MNAHPPASILSGRERRTRIDQAIERLLALLDELDGDPDLEDDDPAGGDVLDEGENSLGTTNGVDQVRAWKPTWPAGDLEYDGDSCPDSEAEPSLGSLGSYGVLTQDLWAAGDRRELEDEHDGREPEVH